MMLIYCEMVNRFHILLSWNCTKLFWMVIFPLNH